MVLAIEIKRFIANVIVIVAQPVPVTSLVHGAGAFNVITEYYIICVVGCLNYYSTYHVLLITEWL